MAQGCRVGLAVALIPNLFALGLPILVALAPGVPPVSYTHLDVYKRQVQESSAPSDEMPDAARPAGAAGASVQATSLLYTW